MKDNARVAGLGGVDQRDGKRALRAWRWTKWVMFGFSLLTIPAFYFELAAASGFYLVGRTLYACMAAGYITCLAHMACISHKPLRFLRRNGCDMLIAIAAASSVARSVVPWSSVEWVLRIVFVGLVAVRIVLSLRPFFTPGRWWLLLITAALLLASAGAGFYWIEPSVHTYAQGVWLAFESSATVGYGDMAPTTPASRVFAAFVVLLGYGLLSLVFASIAAIFVEQDERILRREMHRDIKALRTEIAAMRIDVQALTEVTHVVGTPAVPHPAPVDGGGGPS